MADLFEAGAAIRPERALVPPRDPEPVALRRPFLGCVVEPGLDELRAEPAAGEVRPGSEAAADLVALAHEVEEADQLALVVDDSTQAFAAGGIREELDAARVGGRVVPLVRELVAPLGDLSRVRLGQELDPHGSEPTRAT